MSEEGGSLRRERSIVDIRFRLEGLRVYLPGGPRYVTLGEPYSTPRSITMDTKRFDIDDGDDKWNPRFVTSPGP